MKRALLSFLSLLVPAACSKKEEPAQTAPKPNASEQGDAGTGQFVFERYVAVLERGELVSALGAEWQWLEGLRDLHPIYLTLAGDVLLLDKTEAVWFLDTSYGILERIAANGDAFKTRMQDPAFAVPLLRMDLVDALVARGKLAKPGECYALAVPPSVGGVVSAERARPIGFRGYLDFVGQLAKGIKDLAVGQAFRIEWVGWPGDPDGRFAPKGELVKHARDRRSFAL